MSTTADSVIVELIAKTDGFDGPVNKSAGAFQTAMKGVQASAKAGEDAVAGLSSSASASAKGLNEVSHASGNSRIAMMELGHVARGAGDQFAAGTPLIQIFSQHLGQVAQAASFAGGQGALGKFVAFLSTPWGIALTLGAVVLTKLAASHDDVKGSVEALTEKMHKQADEALNQETANRIWANSLDGVREAQRKLGEEIDKSFNTDQATQQSKLRRLNAGLTGQQAAVPGAQKAVQDAEAAVKAQQHLVDALQSSATTEAGASAFAAAQVRLGQLQQAAEKARGELKKLNDGIVAGAQAVRAAQTDIAARNAEDAADTAKGLSDFIANQRLKVQQASEANSKITAGAQTAITALDLLESAQNDAASAGGAAETKAKGLHDQVIGLTDAFIKGKTGPEQFAKSIGTMVTALNAATAAQKALKQETEGQIVTRFKQSVIGAEGTGPNRLGSSAAGFGQFMPKTFLSYFDRLFPDKASLSEEAKLGFRNVREVANAVIDKATDDYVTVLKKAGQSITAANLYAVHLLGQRDAQKLLSAAPDTPTSSFLSAGVIKGNPFLAGTAGQARANIASRIGDSSGAVSTAAAAIDKTILDQKTKELEREKARDSELAKLNEEDLAARAKLIRAADELDQIQRDAILAARDRTDAELKAKNDEFKLTGGLKGLSDQEYADQKAINDATAERKIELVGLLAAERKLRIANEEAADEAALQETKLQGQAQILQGQEALATTVRERHDLEKKLLDLQYQEEKIKLEQIIAEANRTLVAQQALAAAQQDLELIRKANAAKAGAQAQLDTLPERQSNANKQNDQQNASPLHAYLTDLQKQAGDLNADLENVAAVGLQALTSGITDAIVNFRSMGDVARNVFQAMEAALINYIIQLLIMKALQAAFGGFSGGGSVGGANGASISGTRMATGGHVFGPGSPTSDSIPAWLSNGEYVIKASAVSRVGVGTLDAINDGHMPAFSSGGIVRKVSPSNDIAASAHGGGFTSRDIGTLRSLIGDAVNAGVSAMPDVSLFASFDPADVLQRALGTQKGRRAIIAHVGDNSGAINGALGKR
jgi:hypothetical protein